jgi:hypothetical protein
MEQTELQVLMVPMEVVVHPDLQGLAVHREQMVQAELTGLQEQMVQAELTEQVAQVVLMVQTVLVGQMEQMGQVGLLV